MQFPVINSLAQWEQEKRRLLGPDGPYQQILASIKTAPADQRKELGKKANELKTQIEQWLESESARLKNQDLEKSLERGYRDVTRPFARKTGTLHPITQMQMELEGIFERMGFTVLDGPHVEDEFHNFEALNIPGDHPARDMQDTLWLANKKLLRTHTSPVQIRGMLSMGAPLRVVAPGKVFRAERTDASHDWCFHQIEGLVIDRDIHAGHMKHFLMTLLSSVFKRDVKVRLRPGFFPFVEPGFELDIQCLVCDGKGCSVCKRSGWVELVPGGLVHPNVLKSCKIDPEKYSGFAFGLGLDRLVMMKHKIDDIRLFHGSDIRFLEQFP